MTQHWSHTFYAQQDRLTGGYGQDIHRHHVALSTRVSQYLGNPGTLLELGAGGGQFAVSAARQGHRVTALDLLRGAGEYTRSLADRNNVPMEVVTGDFYTVEFADTFDAVCYWDGFGIGKDDDQRRLLTRIAGWLQPEATAFIDIYTPWYWAYHAGFTRQQSDYTQLYGFDAPDCRLTDTYTPHGGEPLTQSLRCYSPADLRLLLRGTGLTLTEVWPGGHYDPQAGVYRSEVPLGKCMTFTALLQRE
ncbi:class I SAM-dependent methyltransferase [Deinococcus deserti]|uniref:Putative N-methyl-transferase-related protein n=1 Tax=Deinococcus deserti (strain DSM 17065 / CIP 109153 / LMG 22923 / VCD115) TaxID=546414 RepID=C1CWX2_DEIDV|nr:class I SAM-dependent methyltransferase [Deinococcus deserti]ACO46689.1 putative N-methyl-transferase-related protein [Deinococcus deserti VCD115]